MRPGVLQLPRGRLSDPRQGMGVPAHPHAQQGVPLQVPKGCCRDLCATPVPSLVPRVLAGHLYSDVVQPDQRHTSISLATIYFFAARPAQRGGKLCTQEAPELALHLPAEGSLRCCLYGASTAQHGW